MIEEVVDDTISKADPAAEATAKVQPLEIELGVEIEENEIEENEIEENEMVVPRTLKTDR